VTLLAGGECLDWNGVVDAPRTTTPPARSVKAAPGVPRQTDPLPESGVISRWPLTSTQPKLPMFEEAA
jgi:hypothetical protein